MQMWRNFCLVASLVALVSAYNSNSISNNLKPSEWISYSQLESLPPLDEITFEKLENMSPYHGANLLNQIYHLSQLQQTISPSYQPNAADMRAYVFTANGQVIRTQLNQLVNVAQQQPHFGQGEVTVFISGLPHQSAAVKKANLKLINAYLQRYNGRVQTQFQGQHYDNGNEHQNHNQQQSSSEEDYNGNGAAAQQQQQQEQQQRQPTGYVLAIDVGSKIENLLQMATLDIDATGAAIGNALTQLTTQAGVPPSAMHIVGQGIGAHVAGAAGHQYSRRTGQQIRRITALDPSKVFSTRPNKLVGLSRGDAKFVDAIHTSAYGMGVATRVGDVDFYPTGPSVAMPGTDNVIEASMRATRYFAESLRPGNEHNFPAEEADSMQEYQSDKGYARRTYMGIGADYDMEGDFVLEVNAQSPFGKRGYTNQGHQPNPQYAGY